VANSPTVTDWISAISTATLGILGAFITIWRWNKTGFRPKLRARIDSRGEAIELRVVNAGRAAGTVDWVRIVMPNDEIQEDAHFEGFRDGQFRPLPLQGLASIRLIIESPQHAPFDSSARILVNLGRAKPKPVAPVVMPPQVGLVSRQSWFA
jgi:hypothetical protein